jgi:sec-independent protein translocase protein TatB
MEILGIGPLELLFIVLIALLILGPKDMVRMGKGLGQGLNKLVRSDLWKTAREASEKVRTLPTELMREAGMEDMKKSLGAEGIPSLQDIGKLPGSSPSGPEPAASEDSRNKPAGLPEDEPNKIAPPAPGEGQTR